MGLLNDVFGPSKDEIWSQLAAEVRGQHTPDGTMKSGGIRCRHRQWELVLDTCVVSTGKRTTQYTRMRAPFINKDGLYLKLYRKDFLTGIRSFFGMHDIEIGDSYFDEQFIIKGNDAVKIRQLLADPKLKQLIDQQPRISLEIKDDEGLFGAAFPEGVDEVVFLAIGVMKDLDHLMSLFQLFAVLLERLVRIDSAYEDDPGVHLSY
ncbi:MAG: DUF3137 domain-containing protein [Pirellulaceae bacterium]|nr:DUF3137 domain-containing protein [Pirellulaceae bacterium]